MSVALKWNEQGLIPAIVQDSVSKEVLTLAYMNEESYNKTLQTGETWFWSRSRNELWHKGATSGNVQKVQAVRYDCDADALLVLVEPQGPACHNGTYTCFTGEVTGQTAATGGDRFAILSKLEALIASREVERPEGAYTTYLFDKGVDKILKKVGEEAGEVIIAAKNRSAEELRYEASDLLFHLLVLLREQKLPLDEVLGELARRHLAPKKEQ
jgi:phosphoribosyl-ATP pyrophosphohydrolase/phosphoribosyl-AMP cyclohydrolase